LDARRGAGEHPKMRSTRHVHSDTAKNKGRDTCHALCDLPRRPGRDTPQTSDLSWSPPVRIRHTRTAGRAQQRMSWAATGSTCFVLENLPQSSARKRVQLAPFDCQSQGFFMSLGSGLNN
jgi:hypothetical protein